MPKYAEDPIYKTLLELATKAGVTVNYKPYSEEEGIAGNANHLTMIITMLNDDEHYSYLKDATFVFAHEFAHILLGDFYGSDVDELYEDTPYVRWFFEADADKIGTGLYVLACMINKNATSGKAAHRAETVNQDSLPLYAQEHIYQKLVEIALSAGVVIEYAPFTDNEVTANSNTVIALSDDFYNKVKMPNNNDYYETDEKAVLALAKQISLVLVGQFYGDIAICFYQDTEHIRQFFEADIEKIGAALYSLTDMIINHEIEKAWETKDYVTLSKYRPTQQIIVTAIDNEGE